MSNVLSQDEINTLLGGLMTGSVPQGAPSSISKTPGEAIPFSFLNQDRIVRGGMPTLEVIHDRLARLLRISLTQMVRRPVDVQVLNHMDQKYGEFSRTITNHSSLHVLKLEPLRGYGLLVLPGKLVYILLDILFGGTGQKAEKGDTRDFTPIEQRVIHGLTQLFDKQYNEAWKPVFPLQCESCSSETNPQFINIALPSDTVTSVEYELQINDITCSLSVCLPYPAIEPIRETLKGSVISESLDEENTWAQRLKNSLNEAVVDVRALLGSAVLSVRDLLNLKPGDIIQLREDYEHPVEVLIEGVPKFWGQVGSHKCARSIQITGIQERDKGKKHG
jgi:flagellar motor switch protein FliM